MQNVSNNINININNGGSGGHNRGGVYALMEEHLFLVSFAILFFTFFLYLVECDYCGYCEQLL